MKTKTNLLLISALFAFVMAGCEPTNIQDQEPEENENTQTPEHNFSSEWLYDSTGHWHACTDQGYDDLKSDEAPHTYGEWVTTKEATYEADGIESRACSVCGYVNTRLIPQMELVDWSDDQKQIFATHLYEYNLPYSPGGQVYWDIDTQSVVVTGEVVDLDGLLEYADKIVTDGFTKSDGPYQNTFSFYKEFNYKGALKAIEIDLFAVSSGYISSTGEGQIMAVCYDPFMYEWPEDTIDYLFEDLFYVAPNVEVPSIEALRYAMNTNYLESDCQLAIYCTILTNPESSYKTALENKGFVVSGTRNAAGFYVANEPKEIVQVMFQYLEATSEFLIVIQEFPGWPAQAVNYYLDQLIPSTSDTVIPAVTGATAYEFIDSSWDSHGYFFVLCECESNLESSYETALINANYTLYKDAKNTNNAYAAVSENEDLLIQYSYLVNQSIMGGEDYKHFDVMFEPFYPYDADYLASQLDVIQEGTETVIPEYPGLGEDIKLSDNNVNLFIEIQSATYASIAEYAQILKNADWSVKAENELYGNYVAISPDRDIKLTTAILDGRVNLTVTAYEDEYSEWPTEGVNEILTTLGITGTVPSFDGAFGYDYINDSYHHEIVCLVPYEHEDSLIDAYYTKLENDGWIAITDEEFTYYVKPGNEVGVYAYTEYVGEGKVFVAITYGDDTVYDIDVRQAFTDWKLTFEIDSDVLFPGLMVTEEVAGIAGYYDQGETYAGSNLFELKISTGGQSMLTTFEELEVQFGQAGWSYNENDDFFYKEDLSVYIYQNDGFIYIDVLAPIVDKSMLGIMKTFIDDLGYVETTMPESIELTDEFTLDVDTYNPDYVDLTLYLTFESNEKALAAKLELISIFENANWSVKTTGNTTIMTDETSMLKLELTANNKNLVVQIKDGMFF